MTTENDAGMTYLLGAIVHNAGVRSGRKLRASLEVRIGLEVIRLELQLPLLDQAVARLMSLSGKRDFKM